MRTHCMSVIAKCDTLFSVTDSVYIWCTQSQSPDHTTIVLSRRSASLSIQYVATALSRTALGYVSILHTKSDQGLKRTLD